MQNLVRNISLFSLGLLLVTLALEYFRKGHLQLEQPALFLLAILGLGAFGGYMVTWVSQGKSQ